MAPKRMMRPAAAGGPPRVGVRAKAAAKAKAGAKAKVAPKAAGRGPARRGILRRPGGSRVPEKEQVEKPPGERVLDCDKMTVEDCSRLREIEIVEGSYWEKAASAAVQVLDLKLVRGQMYLDVRVRGTQDEDLLKVATGLPGRKMQVHLCGAGCTGTPHGENLIHARKIKEIREPRAAWMNNMDEERDPGNEDDELAALRADREERDKKRGKEPLGKTKDGEKADEEEEESESRQKKKKKKEKSKKRKRRKLKMDLKKDLKVLLAKTGADPDPEFRKRVRKKAAKLARKKRSSSGTGSGSSSESGTAESMADHSMFGQSSRVKLIGARYPGALLASAVEDAAEGLLTLEGADWDLQNQPLPPLFTRYYRQMLLPRMTPAMAREAMTLSAIVDHVLKGQLGQSLDVASQRLKSLEMMAHGSHYTIAQQVELVAKEVTSLASIPEFKEAAKRAREDGKVRAESSRPYGSRPTMPPKNDDWGKQGGKKGGGKNKGNKNDNRKGDKEKQDPNKGKGGRE